MEDHFLEDMAISKELIIRGKYPRNAVYGPNGIHTYDINTLLQKIKANIAKLFFSAQLIVLVQSKVF